VSAASHLFNESKHHCHERQPVLINSSKRLSSKSIKMEINEGIYGSINTHKKKKKKWSVIRSFLIRQQ